jgi:hypothetical protein
MAGAADGLRVFRRRQKAATVNRAISVGKIHRSRHLPIKK